MAPAQALYNAVGELANTLLRYVLLGNIATSEVDAVANVVSVG